ncbi:MAG: alpha/beta hydrolase [Cyanobacteria bacterium P01_A01_bin.84]
MKGYIISDGFKLQYLVEGEGIPTIVVGSSIYYPRTFSKELRSQLKIAFIDHRGFAPKNNCQNKDKYKLNLLVDDIELFREELDFDQFIMIGHSGHAFIALEYANKYRDRVSHLVLIGAAPDFSDAGNKAAEQYLSDSVCPERKALLARNIDRLTEEIAAASNKRAFVTYCLLMAPKSWYDYNYDGKALWEDVEVNMTMFDFVWGEVFRDIDITKNLELLKAPVFLALGRYDYLIPPFYLWNNIREKFTDITICIFEKSSHTPQFEEPRLFDGELLEWILRS